MTPIDDRIAAIAAEQCGTFADRQAHMVGASRMFVKRRVANRQWVRLAEGSLSMPGWPATFERSLWAALHAGPAGALIGGMSAAALYGFKGFAPNRLELLVPHGSTHTNPLAVVTQTRHMPEPVIFNALPLPSRERVLCEVARHVGPKHLGAALDDQLAKKQVVLGRVERQFVQLAAPNWPGLAVMARVIAQRGDGYVPPRSELERELRAIVTSIPGLKVVYEKQIGDRAEVPHLVDIAVEYPRKAILEADGRSYHQRLEDMRRDRERDRRALLLGYPTFRWVFEEIVNDRAGVRAEVCRFFYGG